MDAPPERIPWKRNAEHLRGQSITQLQSGAWELCKQYDDNGPEHEDAVAWIEAGLDICTRIREMALELRNPKYLEFAHRFAQEFDAAARQINLTRAYRDQQSGLVRAVQAGMPPPNDPVKWRK